MPEYLYIRPLGDELEWLLLDNDVVRLRGRATDDAFADLMAGIDFAGEVRLILPGDRVTLTRVTVPTRQARQVQQAVPYLVEEYLATDVEDCHFATGDRRGDDLLVAVIDREFLESCIARLVALGLRAVTAYVPSCLLPVSEGATVQFDGAEVHVAWASGIGLTIPRDLLLPTLLLEPPGARLLVRGSADELQAEVLALSSLAAEGDVEIEQEALACEGFEQLCRDCDGSALNVLQGAYQVKVKRQPSGQGWATAAVLAGTAFLLHLLMTLGQAIYLDQRAAQYEYEVMALYQDVFPRDRNVRDVRRRWASHLRGQGGESGQFLAMLRQLSSLLPKASLKVENVNFNESRGDLILQVEASGSDELVRFSQAVAGLGLTSEIGTISQEDNRVRGSIKIRAGS